MTAVRTFLRRVGGLLRDAWLMLGVTVALLIALEIAGRAVQWAAGRVRPHAAAPAAPADPRPDADAYSADDRRWVADYYREFAHAYTARWEPYVYWKRAPFEGRYINVDADGVRRTAGPQDEAAPAVWMFGGSTMWGTGARDEATIPSFVSRELEARGIRGRVLNLSETGYVSGQELAALVNRLRKGQRPRVVVCYDGVNDVYSRYQQGSAGIPQNEYKRVDEFNLSAPGHRRRRARLVARDIADALWLTRTVRGLLARPPTTARPELPTSAAREVADAYRLHAGAIAALGRQHGFATVFYWQPTAFQKQPRTAFEAKSLEGLEPVGTFYARVTEEIRRDPRGPGFEITDISALFANEPRPIYIDWCHTAEGGNQMIARQMVEDVAPLLR